MKKSAILSTVAIAYFMIGFLVAIAFAIYYHWPFISFLSPEFYSVILTWPFQAIGFSGDLLYYGLTGKQI